MSSNSSVWTGTGLANYVVGLGICVGFISFLGCCGACKENKCLLWCYSFLLFWLILAQTVGLTVCAIGETYTEDFLSDCWESLSTADQQKIEDQYECCSFNGNSTSATQADEILFLFMTMALINGISMAS